MNARARGRFPADGPYRLLVVPVLLGILIMHGGLSGHGGHGGRSIPDGSAGRDRRLGGGPHDAPVPAGNWMVAPADGMSGGSCSANHPGSLDRRLGFLASTMANHGGQLCLAFLRLTGVLLAALLLARAVRMTARVRVRPRRALSQPERSPPSGLPHTRAPSLAHLCVLRL